MLAFVIAAFSSDHDDYFLPAAGVMQDRTTSSTGMMLASLIEVPETIHPSPEDVLSSCVGLLYPNETRNLHGDAGSSVIYKSRKFGNIELRLSDPQSESGRKLFAHYLWNSGVLLAELISRVIEPGSTSSLSGGVDWSVEGEDVLELGAGK